MTGTDAPRARRRSLYRPATSEWLESKDPGGLAVKRSVRAAVLVPSVFGVTHLLFVNPQVSLFGAFGSFALLLLVEFPGRPRTRLFSYVGLFVLGAAFIALGTLVSTDKIAAIAVMAAVGFGVLFAGLVSPQVASASTAALLVFVLPVAIAQPAAAVGSRLLGWTIASAVCIAACMVVWPPPWHDELRRRLSGTVSAIGRLVSSGVGDGRDPQRDPQAAEAVADELSRLRDQFAATPYPPTGSVAGAVALAKLVGRVEWVASNAAAANSRGAPLEDSAVRTVIGTVADILARTASLICDGNGHPVDDPVLVGAVQESTRRLDRLIAKDLDEEVSMLLLRPGADPDGSEPEVDTPDVDTRDVDTRDVDTRDSDTRDFDTRDFDTRAIDGHGGIASVLDPAFRARALGIATEMMADATLEAAGAQAVGDRRLGASPEPRQWALWARLVSHLSFHSVWFRNAVRGGAGLALAVAVVEVTDVEHGFWVVLGTLSVLRSNALGTGARALRAVGGTAVGFVAGSAIMMGVAHHMVLLWVLLPLAVLVAGAAPSMISFAAGQAGFTLVVIILFNIIDPTGWKVGLTRIEDVAIGCAVSIVVGLLFWPRGATAALGRALSDAFVTNSGYLSDAVDRLTSSGRPIDTIPAQRASHRSYMRLDDAFRQFLTERGAKLVSIETVAKLVSGSNRIRLAAYTLAGLPAYPSEPGQPELESVTIAEAVLRDSYASSHRWYEEFAEVVAHRREEFDPLPVDERVLGDVLLAAFEDAREHHRADRLRTTLQMLWADELLENQRQVQADLAASADLFVRQTHHRVMI